MAFDPAVWGVTLCHHSLGRSDRTGAALLVQMQPAVPEQKAGRRRLARAAPQLPGGEGRSGRCPRRAERRGRGDCSSLSPPPVWHRVSFSLPPTLSSAARLFLLPCPSLSFAQRSRIVSSPLFAGHPALAPRLLSLPPVLCGTRAPASLALPPAAPPPSPPDCLSLSLSGPSAHRSRAHPPWPAHPPSALIFPSASSKLLWERHEGKLGRLLLGLRLFASCNSLALVCPASPDPTMSGLLTKRRFSQMPPARRISGPVDGSFVHVDSTTADLSSSINYGTPIASTSAQPIDMANNKVSTTL